MKKLLFVLIGMLLVVSHTACGADTTADSDLEENQGKEVVSDNITNEGNQDSTADEKGSGSDNSSPHEFSGFTKDEEFSGGVAAKEYNLNSVRRGPHPTLTRLIFDFTVGSKGDSAQEPPKYEITYTDEENKVTAVFEGVKYNSLEGKVEEIKQLAPIVEDVQFSVENNKLIMSLILKEKVSYQVFNLSSPARVAIVMSPDAIQ